MLTKSQRKWFIRPRSYGLLGVLIYGFRLYIFFLGCNTFFVLYPSGMDDCRHGCGDSVRKYTATTPEDFWPKCDLEMVDLALVQFRMEYTIW